MDNRNGKLGDLTNNTPTSEIGGARRTSNDVLLCLKEIAYDIVGKDYNNTKGVSLSTIKADEQGNIYASSYNIPINDMEEFDASNQGCWIAAFRPFAVSGNQRHPSGEYWTEPLIRELVSQGKQAPGPFKVLELDHFSQENLSAAILLRFEEIGVPVYEAEDTRFRRYRDGVRDDVEGELSPDEAACLFAELGLGYFEYRNGSMSGTLMTSIIEHRQTADFPGIAQLAGILSMGAEDSGKWRELQQGFDKIPPLSRILLKAEPEGEYPERRYKDALVKLADYLHAWNRYLQSFGAQINLSTAGLSSCPVVLASLASDDFRNLLEEIALDSVSSDFDDRLVHSIEQAGYSGRNHLPVPSDERSFDDVEHLAQGWENTITPKPIGTTPSNEQLAVKVNEVLNELDWEQEEGRRPGQTMVLFGIDGFGISSDMRIWKTHRDLDIMLDDIQTDMKSAIITIAHTPGSDYLMVNNITEMVFCVSMAGLLGESNLAMVLTYDATADEDLFRETVAELIDLGAVHVYDFGSFYPDVPNPGTYPICGEQDGHFRLESMEMIPDGIAGQLRRYCRIRKKSNAFLDLATSSALRDDHLTPHKISHIVSLLSYGHLNITQENFPTLSDIRLFRQIRARTFDFEWFESENQSPDPLSEAVEILDLWCRTLRRCGLTSSKTFPAGIDAGLLLKLMDTVGFESVLENHRVGLSKEDMFPSNRKVIRHL